MKNKTKVFVCSNAGLDYLKYPEDIGILRSEIHFGTEETYKDFVEMDAKTFYERIKNEPNNVPKTSYVSIGLIQEYIEKAIKDGYEQILMIVIAKPLSGLYEALKHQAREYSDQIKIEVFDSKTIAYVEAFMALESYRLLNEENYTMEETLTILKDIRNNNKWYFAVDTLKYLMLNGRLGKLQGTLGTLLKIKPLLSFDKDGKVITVEKIKTTSRALKKVLDNYFEETKDKNVLTYISHAHNDEAVKYFVEQIKEKYPERKVVSTYLTPVVGAHTGPKAIGLGYIDLDKINYKK